jgi:hypothetical protein
LFLGKENTMKATANPGGIGGLSAHVGETPTFTDSKDARRWRQVCQLLDAQPSIFARRCSVVATYRRYRGRRLGPYNALIFRNEGHRRDPQRSIYLGRSEQLADAVRRRLGDLQRPRDESRARRRMIATVMAEYRRQKSHIDRQLAELGLDPQGQPLRADQNPLAPTATRAEQNPTVPPIEGRADQNDNASPVEGRADENPTAPRIEGRADQNESASPVARRAEQKTRSGQNAEPSRGGARAEQNPDHPLRRKLEEVLTKNRDRRWQHQWLRGQAIVNLQSATRADQKSPGRPMDGARTPPKKGSTSVCQLSAAPFFR